MSFRIDFVPERCVACGACVIACNDQNDLSGRSYRRVYQTESESGGEKHIEYYTDSCRHCDDAPCIEACSMECITKDPVTGFTVYDSTDCIGCLACADACPYGAITCGEDGKMEKCDGCNERVKAGLLPACAAVCPFDALLLEKIVQ